MQFKWWWFTLALFLIQLIKKVICVEPITLTLGAAVAGGSALACRNILWIFMIFYGFFMGFLWFFC